VTIVASENSNTPNNLPNVPARIYEDAAALKDQIISDNKGKAGVYLIFFLLKQKKIRTNKLNGKTYIGSSVNLSQRFYRYFSSKYLQGVLGRSESLISRALLKYGYSNFKLEVEYCEPEECLAKEQEWLDHSEPEYNILEIAGSRLGHKHSEAAKAKLREA
jgi:group I intron endonuclease